MSNARRDEAPTSPKSDRVRAVRALDRRALRYQRNEFRVEGPQAVREALKHPEQVKSHFITETCASNFPELAPNAIVVSDLVLAAMTDVTTPQGVIAVCQLPQLSLHSLASPRLMLIADQVRDPGNLGTMIRTADAAGADAIVITGESVDPWSPKVIRSAAGSHWHLPVIHVDQLSEVADWLRSNQIALLAAVGEAERNFAEEDLAKATAWLVGNEAHGLGDEAIALANRSISIPIYGQAESLNVALAAGLLLYASAGAQRALDH